MEEYAFGLLVGKTLVNVEVQNEEVLFVCEDDSAFRSYHMQECCEAVAIENIVGDPRSLVGETIAESIEEVITGEWPEEQVKPDYLDSWTWTYHKIRTVSGKEVTFQWLGESNGYYSESVYFTRTHKPI